MLKSDDKILDEFNKRLRSFVEGDNSKRDEINRCYYYRDYGAAPITEEDAMAAQVGSRGRITPIPVAAAIIKQVAGTEALKQKIVNYVPIDDAISPEADMMADSVKFIEHESRLGDESSIAMGDALLCGLGVVERGLDFTDKDMIAGKPTARRIFPGFAGYDTSVRAGDLNTRGRYVFSAEPVESESVDDYLMTLDMKPEQYQGNTSGYGGEEFFLDLITLDNRQNIELFYNYYWWDYIPIVDVYNPFLEDDLKQLLTQDTAVANLLGQLAEELKLDPFAPFFAMDSEDYKKFDETVEALEEISGYEIEVKKSKRMGRCYYKAQIVRGRVILKERSFVQKCFPLSFITGYYDENNSRYYGLMRPLSNIQDQLNTAMTNLERYSDKAIEGGGSYITGDVPSLQAVAASKAKSDSLTPLPAGTQVTPKAMPNTADVLIQHVRLLMELLPRSVGLTEEFLGRMTTGDMSSTLFGQVMQQSSAVLADFVINSSAFGRCQSQINIALTRLMAAQFDGMVIPLMSPSKNGEQYKRITKQNLARDYQIRDVERPRTQDEMQDAFNNWMALLPSLPPEIQATLWPIVAKYSPFDQEDKDAIKAAFAPAQPAQPDPIDQATREANVRMIEAQADKWKAEAEEKRALLPYKAEGEAASANRDNASATKTAVEAGKAAMMPEMINIPNQPTEPI